MKERIMKNELFIDDDSIESTNPDFMLCNAYSPSLVISHRLYSPVINE